MSPAPNSTSDDPQKIIADLQRELGEAHQALDERTAERDEALEQQTATAEVLGVINGSPGDLAPVFDAILEKAHRVCEAAVGVMATWDGEYFHRVAVRGVSAALPAGFLDPFRPAPGSMAERILAGERVVRATDLREEEGYRIGSPRVRVVADMIGARSYALVALHKGDKLFGVISACRTEIRPVTDKQLALLQNFAAQAVIAMENARRVN